MIFNEIVLATLNLTQFNLNKSKVENRQETVYQRFIIMKSSKIGFFPILGNYRQEHLRRIERRYLSERVNLSSEIQENRPVLCSDGEDFIRTKFPNFPAIYRDSAVNQELLDDLTSVKSIQDMISRLEVEESSAKGTTHK